MRLKRRRQPTLPEKPPVGDGWIILTGDHKCASCGHPCTDGYATQIVVNNDVSWSAMVLPQHKACRAADKRRWIMMYYYRRAVKWESGRADAAVD